MIKEKELKTGKELKIENMILLLLVDIIVITFGMLFMFYNRYGSTQVIEQIGASSEEIIVGICLYIAPMVFLELYRSLWKLSAIEEFIRCVIAILMGFLLSIIYGSNIGDLIYEQTLISGVTIGFMLINVRILYRLGRRILVDGKIFNKITN